MKAYLLHRDRDFDWHWTLEAAAMREAERTRRRYEVRGFDRNAGLPWNHEALTDDLELNTLLGAMAGDEDWIFEVARKVLLSGPQNDIETIRYRQDVLRDCLRQPAVIRQLYGIAVEAMAVGRKSYLGGLAQYPHYVLRDSIELIGALFGVIRRLRELADSHGRKFVAEGWVRYFAMVGEELNDEYLASVERHLRELKFRRGVLLGARLGTGNKASGYVLHRAPPSTPWLVRLLEPLLRPFVGPRPPVYGFSLHPRDEAGARILSDLHDRGIADAARVLGQAADHVRGFFSMLRAELAFYVGCLNLQQQLAEKGEPVCMPLPVPGEARRLSAQGLYDICLSLHVRERVVGNDVSADGRDLIVVTGANQGGKSTFLRSLGLAQLMMQCGMFAPAEHFGASLCDGVFTHFKREEDVAMKQGKLDEELGRMSGLLERITPRPFILFNESFAATNEREGSEIAMQIVRALLESGVRMAFVTHLYEFAHRMREPGLPNVLFLRADRQPDGARTFKLVEGEPLRTSYGEDLYSRIFGAEIDRRGAGKPKGEGARGARAPPRITIRAM